MEGRGQGGFTLVEAIVVMVIIGIVGAMVSIFIIRPVKGYQESVARAEVTDIADLALRRMARELRLALPNSIRVSADGNTVEFLLTRTGGRYVSVDDNISTTLAPPLDFDDTAKTSFAVLGEMSTGKQAIVPGSDFFVVNNIGTPPLDAYLLGNMAQITAVADGAAGSNVHMITLATNPFAAQMHSLPSASSRYQVVSGPVAYQCLPASAGPGSGSVRRVSGHPVSASIDCASGATACVAQRHLIANKIQSCRFEYANAANIRSAVLRMTLTLALDEVETVSLSHQINVDNTP